MIITEAFIHSFVEALNNAYELRTCGTAKLVGNAEDEFVIRYEDLNGYTSSIFLSSRDDLCRVGYLDYDGKYHGFLTMRYLSSRSEISFIIDIAICLHRMEDYIVDDR